MQANVVNGFLKEFLDMRKSLHKTPAPAPQPGSTAAKDKKTAAKSLHHENIGMTMATIIEELPPKKDVCDYFQKECDRLTAQKMA